MKQRFSTWSTLEISRGARDSSLIDFLAIFNFKNHSAGSIFPFGVRDDHKKVGNRWHEVQYHLTSHIVIENVFPLVIKFVDYVHIVTSLMYVSCKYNLFSRHKI